MLRSSPRALVVYESIFGHTKQVAEAVARGLSSRFVVELFEVSRAPARPEGAELVVVGGPIHAYGMTRPATRDDARREAAERGVEAVSPGPGVREWLATLPRADEVTKAAAFDTGVKLGWFVLGSAARGEAAALRAHGYALVAPPEHFLVASAEGPLRDGELARARAWGDAVATAALLPPRRRAESEAPPVAHLRLLS